MFVVLENQKQHSKIVKTEELEIARVEIVEGVMKMGELTYCMQKIVNYHVMLFLVFLLDSQH